MLLFHFCFCRVGGFLFIGNRFVFAALYVPIDRLAYTQETCDVPLQRPLQHFMISGKHMPEDELGLLHAQKSFIELAFTIIFDEDQRSQHEQPGSLFHSREKVLF